MAILFRPSCVSIPAAAWGQVLVVNALRTAARLFFMRMLHKGVLYESMV
ncbi:MAG: hypothetical protein ACR2H4_15020 [Pyrinomonadaceae bacterium]